MRLNLLTLFEINFIKVFILFLFFSFSGLFHSIEAWAQISPEGLDRTYKQAAPHRFDNRFSKPFRPKSAVVPVKPKSMVPVFPEKLGGIKFVPK